MSSESGRRFHTDSRASENFTENGLVSLTGQSRHDWARYVLKELLDNSIEAAEEHTDTPEISVRIETEEGPYSSRSPFVALVEVADNGPGMGEDMVAEVFEDVERFGGTKRHYNLPTRGNQGNALMTILGIQSLSEQPLIIESQEVRHRIEVTDHPISGSPAIERTTEPTDTEGTRIQVDFGEAAGEYGRLRKVWDSLAAFIALNPHVRFETAIDDRSQTFPANDPSTVQRITLSKSATTGKAPWFSFDDFKERLKADARADPTLTLDDVVGEFAKLTSRQKRNAVFDGLEDHRNRPLPDVLEEKGEGTLFQLYGQMKRQTDLYSPSGLDGTLGSVGKDLISGLFDSRRFRGDYEQLEQLAAALNEYRDSIRSPVDMAVYHAEGDVVESPELGKAMPFYFELAAVPAPDETSRTQHQFGINQSVAYSTPRIYLEDVKLTSGAEESYSGIANAFDDLDHPFFVITNLTCPNIEFEDKGKQNFDTSPYEEVVKSVVGKAVRKLGREVRPALNDYRSEPEPDESLGAKAPQGFIKDFVYEYFERAYREGTNGGQYTITMRQLFYIMRPWFHDIAEERGYQYSPKATVDNPKPLELKYNTFTSYVDEFEVEQLGRRVVHRDDRGFFVEPHSNKRIDLQTADVRQYDPNLNEYGTLLFVEKQGFFKLIHQDFELTKRYDVGLINSQGYATNAGRDLIEKVQERQDVQLLTLTDLDINGLGIAEDATKADTLSAVEQFDATRVGVTLEDVREYGLPAESRHYTNSQLTQLENRVEDGLIPPEVAEFLRQNGGQAVEINAFSPVELKEYLETKFDELGVEKVPPNEDELETPDIPDPDDIRESAISEGIGNFVRQQAQQQLSGIDWNEMLAGNQAAGELDTVAVEEDELLSDIRAALRERPPKNWTDINEELVEEIEGEVDKLKEQAREEWISDVTDYLEENVTASFEVE